MTFDRFYRQIYLPGHADPICRVFHAVGPPVGALYVGFVVYSRLWWLLLLTPVPTYLLGWLGHVWAGNHPTFFSYPAWSFRGYWKMLAGMLLGRKPATA